MDEQVIDPEVKEVRKGKARGEVEPLQPFTIKIEPGLKAQIEAVAEQDGKSASEVAREFLEKSLSANPDRKRAGLLRSVAITKVQLGKALEEEPARRLFWVTSARRAMERAVDALTELEDALKE